jgi:hypothetical protein
MLRESLFPTALTSPDPLSEKPILSLYNLQDEFYSVTSREVTSTVNRAKIDTATGPDKISYSTVRPFRLTSPSTLPALFNALFRYQKIPKEWKIANCIVIPKNGESGYNSPPSYRPISLSSCSGKIFESLTARRLSHATYRCEAMSRS